MKYRIVINQICAKERYTDNIWNNVYNEFCTNDIFWGPTTISFDVQDKRITIPLNTVLYIEEEQEED